MKYWDKKVLKKIAVTFVFVILLIIPSFLALFSNKALNGEKALARDAVIKKYGFFLEEVSGQSGVNFTHRSPRLDRRIDPILPIIASTGASVAVCDFDRDGWNDFYVTSSRFGMANALYHNEQNGTFMDVAEKSNASLIGLSPKSGMNVSFGGTYNRGQPGFYISNITEEGVLLQGNNFWVPLNDNNKILFTNEARENGTESGGWSYGAQFGDLNNDGFSDLYVANGFVSGKKGTR